jgi:hypothetical protein
MTIQIFLIKASVFYRNAEDLIELLINGRAPTEISPIYRHSRLQTCGPREWTVGAACASQQAANP